jgi:hypothetical protein
MLQSLNMGTSSTILSLMAHFVSLLGFASLLYFTDKHDGVRIMWSYSMSYVFSLVMAAGLLARPVWKLWKSMSELGSTGDLGTTPASHSDESADIAEPV